MKQKLLLLGAVFFGVLAFMFTFHQINQEKSRIRGEAQDVYLIQVVRDLAENEKITEDAIKEIKVRRFRNSMESSTLREIEYDRKNMVIGREVRSLIQAGSILQWTDLKTSLSSGRSGLTALIRPGYRAISIPVDATSSVEVMDWTFRMQVVVTPSSGRNVIVTVLPSIEQVPSSEVCHLSVSSE